MEEIEKVKGTRQLITELEAKIAELIARIAVLESQLR